MRLNLLDLIQTLRKQEMLPDVHALLADPDDAIRERALKCVRALADPSSAEPLLRAAAKEPDEYLRVELGEALIELGDRRGVPILLDVMASGEARQARKDAWEHLSAHVELPLPFHPDFESAEHEAEIRSLLDWWKQKGGEAPLQ